MKIVLKVLGGFILATVLIVAFGRLWVTGLDLVFLSKPIDFAIEPGNMWLTDSTRLEFNELPGIDSIEVDSNHIISIRISGERIPLGISYQSPDDSVETRYARIYLLPDRGDLIRIRYRHSYFSWPTPFEMNFMTGNAPTQKRYSYYTLTWAKFNGAEFVARWKFEQWKYSSSAWSTWRSPALPAGDNSLTTLFISKRK